MEIETKENLESQYFWYVVITIVFVVLFAAYVRSFGEVAMNTLINISPFHFIILTVASFRITRLFVFDRITQWMRDLCVIVYTSTDPATGVPCVVRTKRVKGLRRVIGDLFGCQWCTGTWVAFLVVALYVAAVTNAFSAGWVIIVVFALAGGASFVQGIITTVTTPRGSDKTVSQQPAPKVCTNCGA